MSHCSVSQCMSSKWREENWCNANFNILTRGNLAIWYRKLQGKIHDAFSHLRTTANIQPLPVFVNFMHEHAKKNLFAYLWTWYFRAQNQQLKTDYDIFFTPRQQDIPIACVKWQKMGGKNISFCVDSFFVCVCTIFIAMAPPDIAENGRMRLVNQRVERKKFDRPAGLARPKRPSGLILVKKEDYKMQVLGNGWRIQKRCPKESIFFSKFLKRMQNTRTFDCQSIS